MALLSRHTAPAASSRTRPQRFAQRCGQGEATPDGTFATWLLALGSWLLALGSWLLALAHVDSGRAERKQYKLAHASSAPPVRWRRVLWTLLGVVVISLLVLVGGYFFGRGQIGQFMAGKLRARLAEDGVFIGWNSADWLPGTGVRMHGLALYRDAAKRDRLALFGIVTARRADPSWLRWDKMNFKAADTQLLLGSGATETRLDHMEVLLLIQPGNTDLQEFHARLQGVRLM